MKSMREYEPRHPLEILDSFLYPNLLKDRSDTVISENITWLTSIETEDTKKMLEEIESKAQKNCKNVELAFMMSLEIAGFS